MKIKIENIGFVKIADVEINGITIIAGENNTGKRFNSVDNIIDNSRDIKKLYELKDYKIRENSSFYINYLQVRNKSGKEIIVDISKLNHKDRVNYIKYSCALPYNQEKGLFSIQ